MKGLSTPTECLMYRKISEIQIARSYFSSVYADADIISSSLPPLSSSSSSFAIYYWFNARTVEFKICVKDAVLRNLAVISI
jgi:hypothetical protein